MINYNGRFGLYIFKEIERRGYVMSKDIAVDGLASYSSDNDTAVQAIIDSYDPLPEAQAEAIARINTAAGATRTKYVTNVPSQDATYQMKLEDARAFITAGYPEAQLASYPFINAEASAMGSTGQSAADLIVATYNGWIQLAAAIEGERRTAIELVKAELDWKQCSAIADNAETILQAM